MFVGHTALALAAKRRTPKLSLAWLFAAAAGLDLLWPILLVLGVERVSVPPNGTGFTRLVFDSYPWSHSLAMAMVWSGVAFGIATALKRSRGEAVMLALLVFSHWALDFLTHVSDLPLWPSLNAPQVGLRLWDHTGATLALETLLFGWGLWHYTRATRPRDRTGVYAFWGFALVQFGLWAGTPFGPPPPSAVAVAWSSLVAMWLLVAWAGWADRHREPRG